MEYFVRLDLAPEGVLETSEVSEPNSEGIEEEQEYRDAFLARVDPVIKDLLAQPIHHSGNVSAATLLGSNTAGGLNQYLLVMTVDVGSPRLDIDALAGPGGTATVVGSFRELAEWPGKQAS